jgi:hypothetical protein
MTLEYDCSLRHLGNKGWFSKVRELLSFFGVVISNPVDALNVDLGHLKMRLSSELLVESRRTMKNMNSTSLIHDIFPAPVFLREFVSFISTLPDRSFRNIIVFLAGTFSWSLLRHPGRFCFFCPNVTLSSVHMFLCPRLLAWRRELYPGGLLLPITRDLALVKDWGRLATCLEGLVDAWRIRDTVASDVQI